MAKRLNRIASIAAGAFLAVAGATPASAALVLSGISTNVTSGETAALTAGGAASFTWSGTGSDTAVVNFTASEAFRIFFTGYTSLGTIGNTISGLFLDRIGSPNERILITGAALVPGTPTSGRCNGAAFGAGGACNPITGTSGTNTTALKPNASVALMFPGLVAGAYRLGFFEGNDAPSSGAATFQISAIPLPAGLPLLLAGVAGIALISRRRRAA